MQDESDYIIPGYKTIFQMRKKDDALVRILCLVKEEIMKVTKIRSDIMNTKFPAIWLEVNEAGQKPIIIGGFYRGWTVDGIKCMCSELRMILQFCGLKSVPLGT